MRSITTGACLAAGCLSLATPHAATAAEEQPPAETMSGVEGMTHTHALADSMPAHGHAPDPMGIGLAATKMPKAGHVMGMYRYMHMDMRQLVDGDNDLSTKDVAKMPNTVRQPGQPPNWRMAPEHMTMDMHMFGVMGGITDDIGVMAMLPYVVKEMSMVTFRGPSGTTPLGSTQNETSGIGDFVAMGLYRLLDQDGHHAHLQLGMSFPTGSTTERGKMLTTMGTTMKMRLPYGMQLGTGTYDVLPGATYWGESGDWNWGATAVGRIHLGKNDQNYSFGNRAYLTGWGGYTIGWGVNLSLRLAQEYAGKINGRDSAINGVSPMIDPDNYGGWKTSTGIGVNYVVPSGALKGNNFGAEVVVPVYQNLNGPQLEDNWGVWAGWRKGFSL